MRDSNKKSIKMCRAPSQGSKREDVLAFASSYESLLGPLVQQLSESRLLIGDILQKVGTLGLEAVLELSAQSIVGSERHPGKQLGSIVRYGSQAGSIALSDRKLLVKRPRLRRKGMRQGGELEIPAYVKLQDDGPLSARVVDTLMRNVSTRDYGSVITEMAETAGVSKSTISRQFIEGSSKKIQELLDRRFDDVNLLIVYLDGIVFADNHILMAVGVDINGHKHALGFRHGSSENTTVATNLLQDLVSKGVTPDRTRLFVIDGAKALYKAVKAVYGEKTPIQRCRLHKIRNVMDHLPKELRDQVKSVLQAAYKLPHHEGIARIEQQASWLEKQYPSASESLREGLEEMFTVNKLKLPPTLRRCLGSTNVIESPNSGIRRRTRRVTRWKDAQMVSRWAAAALLATEKNFRRIMGYKDLWMLDACLKEFDESQKFDNLSKVA